jgi:PAS domain S-box-containing protein
VPARVFDEPEIRDIVATLEHPAIIVRGEHILAVNDVWLKQYGYARADVEGASISEMVTSPDKERIRERALLPDDRVNFTRPLRTLMRTGTGATVPVRVYTSRFHAAEGSDYRLSIVLGEPAVGVEPVFALLALSSDIIGAESQDDVRVRTASAFERAGLRARFWREGAPADRIDEATARRAIAQHVALFVGSATAAESVYIPIDTHEILHVEGPEITGQHAFVFGLIGKLVTTALLDVQASAAAQRKLSDTQLLLQLARTTSETLDLDEVMSVTADSLVQLLDVASCFILLYDDQTQTLRASASSRARRDAVKDIIIPIDDAASISAEAARERKVIVIPDTAKDDRAQRAPFVRRFAETAVAAIPIISRGERLEGVVVVDETDGPRTYTDDWIELASAMVAQVGMSIANARLYESLRKSYEEVAQTRAEMVKRERLAGLGELAAIVAHEVRNPLGVIYNATNSLKRLTNDSADAATLLDIVREECERLNHIVGDLLDFASPRKLTLQAEEIGRILGEVVEAIPESPHKNEQTRFELTIDDALPPVLVDRRLIRQAFLNVALNGVQAMPRGGTLHMRAFLEGDNDVVIEIRDEGPGILDSDLPRIFEPFFTTKATGAGLGLAVVKRIVEDHGGHVWVWSTTTGTTFCFRLPVARTT